MALRPCSTCGQRTLEKHASLYWSWNLADRRRIAYLQRVCVNCFVLLLGPFQLVDFTQEILCPCCHSPSGDDMDPCFCKAYVPGQPPQIFELATCPACAVEVRNRAVVGAELLRDRNPEFGGLAPKRDIVTGWDELGLRP